MTANNSDAVDDALQRMMDRHYLENGKCCAGCDWWRFHNSLVGDCTKSAPVSAAERVSMFGIQGASMGAADAGHIITPKDHVCGDFKDDFHWPSIGIQFEGHSP